MAFFDGRALQRLLLAAFFVTALSTAHAAQSVPAPERVVSANRLVSKSDPAATVRVPRAATYVGGARWPLYDVADCELHVFVEADAEKRVKRFYWIQFEQYLPNVADYRYDYSTPVNVRETHWGETWWRRARFGPTNETPKAGSDLERVYQLISQAGYALPPHMINVRLVRLLDDPQDTGRGRKEMILFYNEDMAGVGAVSEDFVSGGKISAKWAPVEEALVKRAVTRFRVKNHAEGER